MDETILIYPENMKMLWVTEYRGRRYYSRSYIDAAAIAEKIRFPEEGKMNLEIKGLDVTFSVLNPSLWAKSHFDVLYRFQYDGEVYGDGVAIRRSEDMTENKCNIIDAVGELAKSAMMTYLKLRYKEEEYEHVHENPGGAAENTGAEEAGGTGGQAEGAADALLHARADREAQEISEESQEDLTDEFEK